MDLLLHCREVDLLHIPRREGIEHRLGAVVAATAQPEVDPGDVEVRVALTAHPGTSNMSQVKSQGHACACITFLRHKFHTSTIVYHMLRSRMIHMLSL